MLILSAGIIYLWQPCSDSCMLQLQLKISIWNSLLDAFFLSRNHLPWVYLLHSFQTSSSYIHIFINCHVHVMKECACKPIFEQQKKKNNMIEEAAALTSGYRCSKHRKLKLYCSHHKSEMDANKCGWVQGSVQTNLELWLKWKQEQMRFGCWVSNNVNVR